MIGIIYLFIIAPSYNDDSAIIKHSSNYIAFKSRWSAGPAIHGS